MVLEKILESPLDCKEITPVNPKENQPWKFMRGTDAETEAPIFWPPDVNTKAVYYHSAYLTYADYIMRNAGLDEAQDCWEKYQ